MGSSLDVDLLALSTATAATAEHFLTTTREVASGANLDVAIPLLLLAVSDLVTAGARLGAITDVVPAEQFEPDDGPDPDLEPLRLSLANVLDGLDAYSEVIDPVLSPRTGTARLSDDLTDIGTALAVGLQHHRAGRPDEALWWWQYSYLSSWGERAASAARVLLGVIAHLRLDVDDDVAAEAEFDALHPAVPDTRDARGTD